MPPPVVERSRDWGEALDTIGFVSRHDELALLRSWLLEERCRLVALLGMGGIGKTSVAGRLAQDVAPNFERVYWRNLRDAPPVSVRAESTQQVKSEVARVAHRALDVVAEYKQVHHVAEDVGPAAMQVEVNAMNMLGLQYTLHCQVLNREMLDEEPVVSYHHQRFPRVAGMARRYEHVTFDTYQPMENLHDRLIGKDKLVAQLKLKNEETGAEDIERTEVIAVDLAA